jgi:hypothetical protein
MTITAGPCTLSNRPVLGLPVNSGREPVNDLASFQSKIRQFEAGDTILLLVKRQEASLFVTLKVRE